MKPLQKPVRPSVPSPAEAAAILQRARLVSSQNVAGAMIHQLARDRARRLVKRVGRSRRPFDTAREFLPDVPKTTDVPKTSGQSLSRLPLSNAVQRPTRRFRAFSHWTPANLLFAVTLATIAGALVWRFVR